MTEIGEDFGPGNFTRGFERESKRTSELFDGIANVVRSNIARLKIKVEQAERSEDFAGKIPELEVELGEVRHSLEKLGDLTDNVVPVMETGARIRLDDISEDHVMRMEQAHTLKRYAKDLDDVQERLRTFREANEIQPLQEEEAEERKKKVKLRSKRNRWRKSEKLDPVREERSPPLLARPPSVVVVENRRPSRMLAGDLEIRRFLRRRRLWIGAAVLVFLFLLLLLIIVFLSLKLQNHPSPPTSNPNNTF